MPIQSLLLTAAALGLSACFNPNEASSGSGEETDMTFGTGGEADSDLITTGGTESESGSEAGSSTTAADAETDTHSDGGGPECGDGIVKDGEVCDDGINDGSYDGCSPDCSAVGPRCGDGWANGRESCDLGQDNGGSDCNAFCQVPGTVLAEAYETLDVSRVTSSGDVQGSHATTWNGHVTAAFGGWGTTVWELAESEAESGLDIATLDHRLWSGDESFLPLGGALGLSNGNLLLAGGSFSPAAVMVNESMDVVWTFEPDNAGPTDGFVGAARIPGGVVLGARHRSGGGSEFSAYWVRAFAESGAELWDATEVIEGTDNIYGRDLVGIGGDQAVLLTSEWDNPRVRIYDQFGSVVADDDLVTVPEIYRVLCGGENGFFLVDEYDGALVGFDAEGDATFHASVPVPGDDHAFVGCGVRDDNSPVIGMSVVDSASTTLHVYGFDGARRAWTREIVDDLPRSGWSAPTVHVDEQHARAWIFIGGTEDEGVRFVYAAVVAI